MVNNLRDVKITLSQLSYLYTAYTDKVQSHQIDDASILKVNADVECIFMVADRAATSTCSWS